MTLVVGMQVRDVYTNHVGRVVRLDEVSNRCTVRMATYTVIGCQSWFRAVPR